MFAWDPTQYLRFDNERGRPYFDLVARIGAHTPARVLDLGCGDGGFTATLATRWPAAGITGVDSSAEMIDRAQQLQRLGVATTGLKRCTETEPRLDEIRTARQHIYEGLDRRCVASLSLQHGGEISAGLHRLWRDREGAAQKSLCRVRVPLLLPQRGEVDQRLDVGRRIAQNFVIGMGRFRQSTGTVERDRVQDIHARSPEDSRPRTAAADERLLRQARGVT